MQEHRPLVDDGQHAKRAVTARLGACCPGPASGRVIEYRHGWHSDRVDLGTAHVVHASIALAFGLVVLARREGDSFAQFARWAGPIPTPV